MNMKILFLFILIIATSENISSKFINIFPQVKSPDDLFGEANQRWEDSYIKNNTHFTENDVVIVNEGLSNEYIKLFKNNISIILQQLNSEMLPESIKPIKIVIRLSKKLKIIIAEINFDKEKMFFPTSKYQVMDNNIHWQWEGHGISLYLPFQIMRILSQYQLAVADKEHGKQYHNFDKDILNFELGVKLRKSKKESILFTGAYIFAGDNWFNNTLLFNDFAIIRNSKEIYTVDCINSKSLNRFIYSYFWVGKSIGLDGEKTGAYYFCQFFNIK